MLKTGIKLNDYVVVDIENPNTKADSICSIAFIQVKNNEVVNKKYTLINPEDRFDDINMRVNKITPNMVKDEITFKEFWEENKNIFENNILVGHGVKYDLSVITKALKKYDIEIPNINIICTQKLAQKYLNLSKLKLNEICNQLNIELLNHHNAMDDTHACYKLFDFIINEYEISDDDVEFYHYENNKGQSNGMKILYSDDTKSLQNLKHIVEGIMSDNKIELDEIDKLNQWLDDNIQLVGNYPFDKIYSIVKNILTDGIITSEEFNILNSVFNEFIDPIKTEGNNNLIFENKVFCLTGTFNSGSKDDVEQKIVEKGGICGKGVTSKTNYLIVGGAGSDAWKFGNYGGKVQKAMELKEKGQNIEIVAEEDIADKI